MMLLTGTSTLQDGIFARIVACRSFFFLAMAACHEKSWALHLE